MTNITHDSSPLGCRPPLCSPHGERWLRWPHGPDNPAATEPADTTTGGEPTPTETTATTDEPHQIAPGLTTEGVTDALALANAHREQLRAEMWVARDSYERTNATATVTRQTTVYYQNESRWRWNRTGDGLPVALGVSNGTLVQYADGERVVWRLEARGSDASGNVTYGLRHVEADGAQAPIPPDRVFSNSLHARNLVYTLFANANTTVDTVEGVTAYVEGSADELTIGGERATNVSFQATVDSDGMVLSLELTYETGDATVRRVLEFDEVDADPVERPGWYETALNRTAV